LESATAPASSTSGSSGGIGDPLLHPHWHLLGMTFNSDTLITMWIIMAVLVVGCTWIVRTANPDVPTPLQNALEYAFDFIGNFVQESVNPKTGTMLFDYLATTLLFLVVATLAGIIPFVHSPISDADVPIGMAAIVFVMTHYYGFRQKGLKYFGHFAPAAPAVIRPVLVLMALIELVANPVTLSMRIFGNIFAGELLTHVLDSLLPFGFAYIIGVLPQVAWLLFSMFVAAIQSYVFMALTLTYVGMATADEHESEERSAA
jgi:F-type H+-transporting ATPase subunit a